MSGIPKYNQQEQLKDAESNIFLFNIIEPYIKSYIDLYI